MPANQQQALETWQRHHAALKEFLAAHGRAPKQRETWDVDGTPVAVGRWLMHQRQRGAPTDAQQVELDATLERTPVSRDDAWQKRLDQVTTFVVEHGRLPGKTETWHGHPIGQWVADVRKAYRKGVLSDERVAACEALEQWQWFPQDEDFATGLAHFRDYRTGHGTGWVPVRYVAPDGFPLGSWARDRRRHRHSETPSRRKLLTDAGFVYDTPPHDKRPHVPPAAPAVPSTGHARGSAEAWKRRRAPSDD